MTASYRKYTLEFKQPSGTSRGILRTKDTFYLVLFEDDKFGIGECGLFRGLSIDDRSDYEEKLQWVCDNINLGRDSLTMALDAFPSIQIGLEMAFNSFHAENPYLLYPSAFTDGQDHIPINGLIWMGSEAFMKQQIKSKIEAGFSCLKMKIGAIDFQTEVNLLKSIRKEYTSGDIELRVDANGAFSPEEALEKLKILSEYQIHSIEQPIQQGQRYEMARLCEYSPLPIALDEELIGVFSVTEQHKLLQTISPDYIILKPSLIGGFLGSDMWIQLAEQQGIGWWITSALESNIGLNAIAQYTYTKSIKRPQGLGTGGLFTNNIECPLQVKNGTLQYNIKKDWIFNLKMLNLDL
ncbi:o-succinylbenzoate synthase [Aestuariivivens sediminicola]|uniref:o-succinylbenzoate synthase n=1 Tax=Aestuariivivens sediminicola TaxID=2913560 RepID=UPI001F58487C|nr:o-succinylbenzoate synthase [Aestuariivivens sediminicola]